MINSSDSFEEHNEWYIDTPASEDRCPQYLQEKHGDIENGQKRDGDPAEALQAFHTELQKKAIQELKAQTGPDLWTRMMKRRFPGGWSVGDEMIEEAEQECKE
jgi:hypothetical protein